MQFIKLETREQLEKLRTGDLVIVDWGINYEPVAYTVHHINKLNEVILDKKKNHYFSIDMYLKSESNAKEIYLVTK